MREYLHDFRIDRLFKLDIKALTMKEKKKIYIYIYIFVIHMFVKAPIHNVF